MSPLHQRTLLPLFAVLTLTATSADVHAQTRKAANVVYFNDTKSPIRVEARYLIDSAGNRQTVSGYWDLKPGARVYLMPGGKKMYAHQFGYVLKTPEGSSNWTGTCNVLDIYGDFRITLNESNLTEHRRIVRGSTTGGGGFGTPARTANAGPVYIINNTRQSLTLTCRYYLDAAGKRQYARGGAWTLAAGSRGALKDLNTPFTASHFEFTLKSAEGSTDWHIKSVGSDGNLTLTIDDSLMRQHLVRLGKTPGGTPPLTLAGGTGGSKAAREAAMRRAVGKVLVAAVANAIAGQKPKNLAESFVIELARRGRDEAIESALRDVFPTRPAYELTAARVVIAAGLDGKMNVAYLTKEQAKEAIINHLRAKDARMGAAAELADFIHAVMQARGNR